MFEDRILDNLIRDGELLESDNKQITQLSKMNQGNIKSFYSRESLVKFSNPD